MSDDFQDPKDKLHRQVVNKLEHQGIGIPSVELQKVYDNLQYTKKAADNPIKLDEYKKKVFGAVVVDMSGIEKNNIWDRSIFTTDKLCRMFLSWTVDQLTKYEKKKRRVDSKMLFLLILLGGGGLAVVVIVLFLMGAI